MATMNISLPDKMKKYVEARVAEGNYSNVSDYVRDVIRKDSTDASYHEYLKQAINDGLESPHRDFSRDEMLNKLRRQAT